MPVIPECCICRLSLKNNLCVEKNCGNIFHYNCMIKWMELQKSCPLCKSSCCKKNLLCIHYEINENNKIKIDENILNKSKDELYEELSKYEADLIKTQNENEKYALEILTLTNKNKILTETVSKSNVKINEGKIEKEKLKDLKDEYLKDKILLTAKIEEYEKELKKYKLIENFLEDLNKEDLNRINLLFGFNILSISEQKNVILNYIKNCMTKEKKNEHIIKELNEQIIQRDNQIQNLKEKLYKYKLNDEINDSNENKLSNDEKDTKPIKIKNKIIRRVATLESKRNRNTFRYSYNNNIISSNNTNLSKSKTSNDNILSNNNLDFINFIDNKINNSNSLESIQTTPKRKKFHPIEIDLLRNKSVDKLFSNLIDKNVQQQKKENFELYSNKTEPCPTQNNQSTSKTQLLPRSSLKVHENIKTSRHRKRKSLNSQSSKITDFFKKTTN
ncbi:conserved Plasmodium protein, unknown function [Plasmodium sp. DRC-Itaito]|nr:conserved Plasmodium protein, unknown function [Plasmodium sp. DRC-Itaito]